MKGFIIGKRDREIDFDLKYSVKISQAMREFKEEIETRKVYSDTSDITTSDNITGAHTTAYSSYIDEEGNVKHKSPRSKPRIFSEKP